MSQSTQFMLTDEQYARLCEEARRTGLTLAELVRRAVERSYGGPLDVDVKQGLDESFGAWKDRDFDGEEYVDRVRRGLGRRAHAQWRSSSIPPC